MRKASALETGKARRKKEILEAARAMVRASAEGGLVMRALAEKAGVSLATPYNLFGSKRAVLLELFQSDAIDFGALFEAQSSSDRLNKIFELNEMTYKFFDEDPDYYRGLLSALYKSQDAELRSAVLQPRTSFLKRLLRECIADGILDASTNAVLLARLMVSVHSHVAQDWAAGAVTSQRAVLDISYGYATILLSAPTRRSTQRLIELQQDFQSRLEQFF